MRNQQKDRHTMIYLLLGSSRPTDIDRPLAKVTAPAKNLQVCLAQRLRWYETFAWGCFCWGPLRRPPQNLSLYADATRNPQKKADIFLSGRKAGAGMRANLPATKEPGSKSASRLAQKPSETLGEQPCSPTQMQSGLGSEGAFFAQLTRRPRRACAAAGSDCMAQVGGRAAAAVQGEGDWLVPAAPQGGGWLVVD